MTQLKEVVNLINKIGRTNRSERTETIRQLQDKIWDEPELQSEELYFLQELAGDLNFYEPVEQDRDTSLGYYDDEKLSAILSAALSTIEARLT